MEDVREVTMSRATVVLFLKNGYTYVAYTDSTTVGCYDGYVDAVKSLKHHGYRKLVMNGNIEFWGK